MSETTELKPLWSCRTEYCASERSYHSEDLLEHPDGGPVCVECWDQECPQGDIVELKTWKSPYDALREENTTLRKALKHSNIWVKSALACKSWVWSGDQREAAESSVNEAKAVLKETGK